MGGGRGSRDKGAASAPRPALLHGGSWERISRLPVAAAGNIWSLRWLPGQHQLLEMQALLTVPINILKKRIMLGNSQSLLHSPLALTGHRTGLMPIFSP